MFSAIPRDDLSFLATKKQFYLREIHVKTNSERKTKITVLEQKEASDSKKAKVIASLMANIFEDIVTRVYDQSDCNTILKKYPKNKGGKLSFIAESKDRISAAVLQVLSQVNNEDLTRICSYLGQNGTEIVAAVSDPKRRNNSFENLTPLNSLLCLVAAPALESALMHGCVAKEETDELLQYAAYRILDAFAYWKRFGPICDTKFTDVAR
jgi:hypothetical protein